MSKRKSLHIAKFSLILGAAPLLLYAYEYGPLPGYTGAPGDNQTSCVASGCHSGKVNSGPGSVKITLPSGNSGTYTPGQSMQLLVQITDSTKAAYGFQMTARMGSNGMTQAGGFAPTDKNTFVQCTDSTVVENLDPSNGPVVTGVKCPTQFPIEYIEHDLTGYTASLKTTPSFTYTVNWTPPATASGNVTLYVAGNAGPGNPPVPSPTDVYTSSLTLTPAAASSGPTITTGGVVPVYSSATTIQPGSWVSIFGTNLAAATTVWNGNFPTSLGNVGVTINGKSAYLWYVSSGQINLQAPDDTATGSVPVVVTTASGTTTSTVTLGQVGPAFLLLGDGKHATGLIFTPNGGGSQGGGTYDFLGPVTAGAGFRPVKTGEPLVLYGIGFGPTTPKVAAGSVFTCAATGCPTIVAQPQITLGGVPVTLNFGGVVGAGLYQFNFTVPANVASGDQALVAIVDGVQTQASVFVPVQ
jgi:uncharacterized protein (TIGR03437 family)